MMRDRTFLGSLLLAGVAACAPPPQSPETGLTSAVQAPQPPDLGRGPPRVETQGSYHIVVADPVLRVCSGPVPFFEFDSSRTRDVDQPTMQNLTECMLTGPLRGKTIRLVGRTDPRGTAVYNDELGLDRALRVKHYLVAHGVDANRVEIGTAGKSEASSEPESWPKDRRVDVQLVP